MIDFISRFSRCFSRRYRQDFPSAQHFPVPSCLFFILLTLFPESIFPGSIAFFRPVVRPIGVIGYFMHYRHHLCAIGYFLCYSIVLSVLFCIYCFFVGSLYSFAFPFFPHSEYTNIQTRNSRLERNEILQIFFWMRVHQNKSIIPHRWFPCMKKSGKIHPPSKKHILCLT